MQKRRIRHRIFVTLGTLGLVFIVSRNGGHASDVPPVGKVEFENGAIIAVRIHMAPHEKTPMHDISSARLVIWLTDAHLKDTAADGSATEYARSAGSMDWITPRRHMGENLSDEGLDFLAIIPKTVSATDDLASRHAHPLHGN